MVRSDAAVEYAGHILVCLWSVRLVGLLGGWYGRL